MAQYGAERYVYLTLFHGNKHALKLYELAQRRRDLKHFLVQEKNRFTAPRCNELIKASCSCARMIEVTTEQIGTVDKHTWIT